MSLIKINNQYIPVKEFNNQRVVTFKDIDLLHQRTDGIARKNFNNNIQHFIENTDYFSIKPSDVNNFPIPINNAGLTLITESGYLMLVKSFQDDLAWKVQRELVNGYFRVNEQKQLSPMDQLRLQYQVIEQHEEKLSELDTKVENLALTMNITDGQAKTIQALVHKRVKTLCCGDESSSYQNQSLRKKVYRYIWKALKDYLNVTVYHNILRKDYSQALKYLDSITLQGALLREVQDANNQVNFSEEVV
ncbi:ORF6C domain-containing protein [Clostridium hydrogenum]|uniref:ORF6C domain-containing protein n=1 Tax=Clostridium hydrogenum TaxID=2855764 RepID=UPI001F47252F|nr:ORF6C domain-containing protein [Clostridium hydrogenum]